jgi:AraC-like DNA-binding protein
MSILDRSKSALPHHAAEPEYFSLQIAEARRFHFPPAGRRREPLLVVSGGVERCAADYHVVRSGFPLVGIEFVASGRGKLVLGGRRVALAPGVAFCYDHRVPHDIRSDPRDPLVKYFVDLDGASARRLLRKARFLPGDAVHSASPETILSILDEIVRTGRHAGRHVHRVLPALAQVLLLRIDEHRAPVSPARSRGFESYLHCRRVLERHAAELRSVRDLAARCGASPEYLCRLFKRFDTQSPYRRLLHLRMAIAADRLQDAGVRVQDVARELGFATPFHFARLFHRTHGMPPSEYARRSASIR